MSLLLLFQPSAAGGPTFTFALDPGSYSLSGSPLTMQAQRLFALDPGSYSTTGASLDMLTTRLLSADSGNYTLSGFAMSMGIVRPYPLESQVATGVTYGPNGTEYTGTLSAAGGGAYIRRR